MALRGVPLALRSSSPHSSEESKAALTAVAAVARRFSKKNYGSLIEKQRVLPLINLNKQLVCGIE